MSEQNKKATTDGDETIDYGEFLSTSATDVQTEEFDDSSSDPDYYRPAINHKNAKDRVYKGRGRFVPNVLDRNTQKISKYIFCLPSMRDENSKFYIDTPEGEAAKKNIITQAFFALKEHESVTYQQIAKEHFSRKMYHWMLYLVMNDVQDPDMVGKIKIFRFGKKINDKIEYESKKDPSVNKTSEIAVHDPFQGKDLILHINEITNDRNQKMTNYDQSKFDDIMAISLDGGATRLEKNQENMKILFEFLKNNSPELTKAAHKVWTEDEEEMVVKTVQYLVDDDILFNQIYKKSYNRNFFTNPTAERTQSSAQKAMTKKDDKPNNTVEFEDDDKNKKSIVDDEKSNKAAIKETSKNTGTLKEKVIAEDAHNASADDISDDALEIKVEFEEE